MIYEVDKETVEFICKKKISFNQFVMCLLINAKDTRSIIQIQEELGPIGNRLINKGGNTYINELDDLIERGFILNHEIDKRDPYALDNFVVTPKFTTGFLGDQDEMCNELWTEYPPTINIQGSEYPTKVCDKEEFCEKYIKAIKGNVSLHKEIIAKLRIYKSGNQYAQMKLMNFVGSRHWENLNGATKPKTRTY